MTPPFSDSLEGHKATPTDVISGQQTPSSNKSDRFWDEALNSLNDEDKAGLNLQHTKMNVLDDLLHTVEQKKDICTKKQWRYKKSNGEVVIIRDLLDKVLSWVKKFKEIGDVIVQFDTLHAALPWAGVRFLLQVC